jgi:hypothetical protein
VANRRHVAAIKLLANGVQLTRRTSGYKGGQLSKSTDTHRILLSSPCSCCAAEADRTEGLVEGQILTDALCQLYGGKAENYHYRRRRIMLGHKMCLATMSHAWDCYITKLGVRNMRLFHYLKIGEWFLYRGNWKRQRALPCWLPSRLPTLAQWCSCTDDTH